MTESLKMTTLSMKMLDFEGSKGPRIVQNGYPGGFKIKNFQNINCKAAAERILEALGWKRGRAVAVLTECARPVTVSFRRVIRLIRLAKPRPTWRAPARGPPYLVASRIPLGPGRGLTEDVRAFCPSHIEVL